MPGGGGHGSGQPKAASAANAAAAQGDQAQTNRGTAPQGQGGFERGLDSGLAKAAPSAQGLTQVFIQGSTVQIVITEIRRTHDI